MADTGFQNEQRFKENLSVVSASNKFKIISLNSQQVEVSFKEIYFLTLNTILLIYFTSSRCVDKVFKNQTNCQEYKYDVCFLQDHTLTVTHFMNGEAIS